MVKMQVKEMVFYLLFAGLCINGVFSAMSFIGIQPVPLTPWDADQFEENMNATELVESMGWRETDYYGNIIDAIRSIWNRNIPLIEGFTAYLTAMNVPSFIIDLVKIPYRFVLMWSLFFLWRGG